MLQEVNDDQLKDLQKLHSKLIREYEDIIKQKIDIFGDMIGNLRTITDTNSQKINNEEIHAQKKLEIEMWERDIYQKRRVALDFARDVQAALCDLDAVEFEIKDRRMQIEVLQAELNDAQNEKDEFLQDSKEKDDRIAELEK